MLQQRAVGTFLNYQTTEIALRELKSSGFVMERVSVAGPDLDRHPDLAGAKTTTQLADIGNAQTANATHPHNENEAAEDAKKGALAGGTVGGLTGLLVGLGALAIPGVGPVMLAGAAATAIATTVSGGAIGAAAGSLAGGLVGLNVPEDRAKEYGERVDSGEYLVMVEGSPTEIAMAESIFNKHHIHGWYAYDSNVETAPTSAPTAPPNTTPVVNYYLEK